MAGYDDYDAFGQILQGRSSNSGLADTKYKLRHPYYEIYVAEIPPLDGFTGKERDAETSLDYFGARYYDSWRGQWLSVDPMAEKYPGWSPYNYAVDNAIIFVDPNGDTIITSQLPSGQLKTWNTVLSEGMKSKSFRKVYDELQNSAANYIVRVGKTAKENAAGHFDPNDESKLHTGGTLTLIPDEVGSVGAISHELFHAYQNDLGPYVQGSTGKEVEADLFQQVVSGELGKIQWWPPSSSPFDAAFQSLLINGFNDSSWRQASTYFNESGFNSGNLYNRLNYIYYPNPLIRTFLP